MVHQMPEAVSIIVAIQETNAALALAQLAAVEEGLGTCLHSIAMPPDVPEVKATLNLPDGFLPVWLQLIGYPAEGREAGGQRPRLPFDGSRPRPLGIALPSRSGGREAAGARWADPGSGAPARALPGA